MVAAANYEARKYGVHSAIASARAQRLCPQAVVIRPRIEYYAAVSQQIREIFEDFTPLIEPLSLDEAFLDATGSESLFGPSAEIGRQIKERIRAELQLVASVGVAPNKFVAKIDSDARKPDGFVVVEQADVQDFLDPLPMSRIWGVGKVTGQVFEQLGIRTIGELRKLPLETLNEFSRASDSLAGDRTGLGTRKFASPKSFTSTDKQRIFTKRVVHGEVVRRRPSRRGLQ